MERFQNTRQPDWDWWGKLWPAPGETLRRLDVNAGDTLAEIGSGNGYFALPAARIADLAPVYALDIDERAAFVREAFESLRPGGRFIVVNWKDIPRERTPVAGELRGPPTELRLSPDETERAVLDAAEFTLARSVELPPYHYGFVFER